MTNPTTYFNWQMPTSTDLVTDLPADFEVFGQAVDTDFQGLLGGTTGQVLSKTSATDLAFTWIEQDDTTLSFNAQTGTTYSLVQGDNGRVITMNNASAITLTIPAGLTAGFNCMIVQYGAGTVTIAGSGVTVVNRSNYTKTGGQYAIVTIVSPVANTFITGGDMQ